MASLFNELHVFADFNCAFLLTTCGEVSKKLSELENREKKKISEEGRNLLGERAKTRKKRTQNKGDG